METFYHEFKGFGTIPSKCEIRIIKDPLLGVFICFVNIGDGTSVTNSSEQLATEIVNKFGYDPNECRFFETYAEYDYDVFDEIEYTWEKKGDPYKNVARLPKWRPAPDNIKQRFI